MDWKLAVSTFALVFVAEIGDKTQLASFSLAVRSQKPLLVFISASCALVLVTGLGVLVGDWARKTFPEKTMSVVSALLFIGVGVFLLVQAFWHRE